MVRRLSMLACLRLSALSRTTLAASPRRRVMPDGWREIFTDDLILLAIKKAALAGIRKWNYVNGILKAWKNEGVKTIGDVQSRDERRNPPAGQQQKSSAKDDYDAIFGGLG